MNNKKLGIILVIVSVALVFLIFTFNSMLGDQASEICSCVGSETESCPHEKQTSWQIYFGMVLSGGLAALGVYLVFFEKSQREILSTLEKQKQIQTLEEKFNILLKGLNIYERKVIKAVREQDGITQQTLRIRTDMHKSKLSIVLGTLEEKWLIKRVQKGKTNQVFLKIVL